MSDHLSMIACEWSVWEQANARHCGLRFAGMTPYAWMMNATLPRAPAVPEPVTLDLTGLKCPLPALRTAKALKGLVPGQRLIVTCTDPMAAIDIPNLIRETGDVPESSPQGAAMPLVFHIRKAG